METIELKNIYKLVKLQLTISKKVILGWTLAIAAFLFLYMILFPSVQDMATLKMEAMPQELLQLMGMEELSDMGDFVSYFGIIYGLLLVAVSIFSTTFSAGLIGKEEKNKTIEFLYAQQVNRNEIYFSKIFVSMIGCTVVLCLGVLTTLVCGIMVGGPTFDFMAIISGAKIASISVYFFAALAFMLVGISTKLGSGGVVSGCVLGSYLVGYLGQLLGDNGTVLTFVSPFLSFSVEKALQGGTQLWILIGCYVVSTVVFLIIGMIFYNKRDFEI